MQKLVPDIEALAISSLESWAAAGTVINTYHEMKKVHEILDPPYLINYMS